MRDLTLMKPDTLAWTYDVVAIADDVGRTGTDQVCRAVRLCPRSCTRPISVRTICRQSGWVDNRIVAHLIKTSVTRISEGFDHLLEVHALSKIGDLAWHCTTPRLPRLNLMPITSFFTVAHDQTRLLQGCKHTRKDQRLPHLTCFCNCISLPMTPFPLPL